MRPGQQPKQYCSSFEGVSAFDQAVLLLPCWTKAWIECGNKTLLALLPTASIDKACLVISMQFSIGKMLKGRHDSITLCPIDRTDYHSGSQTFSFGGSLAKSRFSQGSQCQILRSALSKIAIAHDFLCMAMDC